MATTWFTTTLRIKEPTRSIAYYTENYNCTLLRSVHHPSQGFSTYFLTTLPPGVVAPAPESAEAENFLWTYPNSTLQLLHNHASTTDDSFSVNNGNVEPHRGFGHIAFNVDDVYAASADLEAKGVKFQKKPDEGRMKGLAFALDPDGYWVEIVRRKPGSDFPRFNLSQTMIRVKDPARTLPFYQSVFDMKLLCERHFESGKFSLFFLSSLSGVDAGKPVPANPQDESAMDESVKTIFNPVLELTHNHGTESDAEFAYHNGNVDPKGFVGLAFLTDNTEELAAKAAAAGGRVVKKADEGNTRGTIIIADPDNYHIELFPRGLKEASYIASA